MAEIKNLKTCLVAVHLDKEGNELGRREVWDKVVTDDFVEAIVDALQSSGTSMQDYKWHQSGTGTTAEVATSTQLAAKSGSRQTGTQVEGTSANAYQSVCTITYSATASITEHGLFSASSTGGGILMDRTLFAAVNVDNGDKIQFTFTIQFSSGG